MTGQLSRADLIRGLDARVLDAELSIVEQADWRPIGECTVLVRAAAFTFGEHHKMELFLSKDEDSSSNDHEGRINVAAADVLIEGGTWYKPGRHATIWRAGAESSLPTCQFLA
ncbi:hypothetical protein COCSUDRAFT_62804 [Coccomyxa subellipsoidea C-169]|uniref:Uncharacterized protein n=1 Tax=Coccomyxa subellipsoidea (strain C-169) TaxID=574566 RepID=I0Z0Y3_COCSC|nr:hypothetical protein COCSUDRAFT_62804 [Coccomyxa subellipsoidea C-169]EIE24302.1 hypothetical protein COCSUDRAFT_62804 [Coccomyxa subellipsoidea C-169]|eukprot:XP_005648846.1 hypothetical protein COCSUDRAFT_62804 [Coccomyxa subellipsoidea C-169]